MRARPHPYDEFRNPLRNLHDVSAAGAAQDVTVPGTTGRWSEKSGRTRGAEMYPGLSEADCQVAGFRYQQLVNEGRREQVSAGARPVSVVSRLVSVAVRQQVGALLVCAGQRLQGVQAATGERIVPSQAGEMSAIA